MAPLLLLRFSLTLIFVSTAVSLRVSSRPPLTCSRQGLQCNVSVTNCLDHTWSVKHQYTPSGPEDLRVSVETRADEAGRLQPTLLAEWTIKDEGSISHLKATELHVLVMATNENWCVRFTLSETLPMKTPAGEKWSFFADMLVLQPGQSYRVSAVNIPKPEMGHSFYDVSQDVTVPDCDHFSMKTTQFCMEQGSMWEANISVSADDLTSVLTVAFRTDVLSEEYSVMVRCAPITQVEQVYRNNQMSLNASFSLDSWPRSCCQFVAEIKPMFPACGNGCTRLRRPINLCRALTPTDAPPVPPYTFVSVGLVIMCVVAIAVVVVLCRRPGRRDDAPAPVGHKNLKLLKQAPKVLVIYSQDHRLYRDIVLKLCAFLQAKCGTKVLVDLLDSTGVGMVGNMPWLEWQRQQLKNRSDKILVLCSKGVQAKWRAICGQARVVLREDVLSPTDDMLTPFLNLALPDMHQAAMLGKYMVAYFDDVSSEEDVPSVFGLAVKFKLMKHFEELFFSILDEEKYQPDHVKHIEGIGGDEYFNCPSGFDLKNAIETFQAYQLENPNWFEKECMALGEEMVEESKLLLEQMQIRPVLECVPLIREGHPICIQDVEISESSHSVHVLTPELNTQGQILSVVELAPSLNPEVHQCPSNLIEVLAELPCPHSSTPGPIYSAEPVLNMPPPGQTWPGLQVEPSGPTPTEDDEEDSLPPASQISSHLCLPSSTLQGSLDLNPCQSESLPEPELGLYRPVEMEARQPRGKSPASGSDQGYMSKMSSQPEVLSKDPLAALRRLQMELLQDDLRYFEEEPQGL